MCYTQSRIILRITLGRRSNVLPKPLSLTARTLYAELRELALAAGAVASSGGLPGAIVRKTVRGSRYVYYQYRDLDGRTKQAYLGPDDDGTRALADRIASHTTSGADDSARIDELRAAFIAAGGFATEHAPMRVLKAFADAGILRPGAGHAVLVGTHAFNALGNLLGVRWSSQVQTQDIDLAAEGDVDIAVAEPEVAAADVLTRLEMGFIPVPSLDRHSPSTSFRVRGQELRVDLLTPQIGKPRRKRPIVAALNAPAEPVRFLDYLLAETVPALLIGRRQVVLANVPLPERFGLHKLLVSESRATAFATKAEKDRLQATQVIRVLRDEAPDGLARARRDLLRRGPSWRAKWERALKRVDLTDPELAAFLREP